MRLDYLSCVLTVLSTVMVGRRKWEGWLVAGANSAIISVNGWSRLATSFRLVPGTYKPAVQVQPAAAEKLAEQRA